MQCLPVLLSSLALFVASLPAAQGARAKVNPLGQVINLLDSLAAKVTKEGELEAKAYKKFAEWCDSASQNAQFEIKTATMKKAKLEAAIAKSSASAEASSDKIEELAGSLASSEADLKNAAALREREAADFASGEAELMETIDTLTRALSVLEREMAKNPAAFAQLSTSNMQALTGSLAAVVEAVGLSSADGKKLVALVQSRQTSDADDAELGPPAAAVYKTHGGGIVDVLEDLKEKAEEQLSDLRKAETASRHNYAMLKQSLEDQSAVDNKDLADEKADKAAAEESKATASGDLDVTVKELADAKSSLTMSNGNCMQTAADHEATMKARDEELKVIAEAKNILLDTTGGAEKQSYSLVQMTAARAASRMQTRADLANSEVLASVRRLAKQHHSSALAQLASRIASVLKLGSFGGQDPFAKVKMLINDLIAKLEAEAGSEATEKAYCDEQLAKTEEKKGELEDDISKLTAKIDTAAAKSADLKAEVQELQGELAALAKQQAEMDKIRQETHADYVQAKADLEQGLIGVRKALGVLRDYYGGGAEAAMLQATGGVSGETQQPAMPEAHSKATGAGSSIVGILEVVESDFAKNLATEETQESDAQDEYEKTSQANKITKATKEQDVTYKTKEHNGLDKSIADLTGDRETTDSELKAVLEYYAKVKERCIAKPESYEQRKARRTAEIQGLKEALTILQDETAFVQRGRRGASGHHVLGMPRQ